MYPQNSNLPSPPNSPNSSVYDIEVPATPLKTKEVTPSQKSTPIGRSPKLPTGALLDLVQENKVVLYQVWLVTGAVVGLLKAVLPDAELLKIVVNPLVHVAVPVCLIYFSSEFGWKKGGAIGFFWLLGFTPIALLITR